MFHKYIKIATSAAITPIIINTGALIVPKITPKIVNTVCTIRMTVVIMLKIFINDIKLVIKLIINGTIAVKIGAKAENTLLNIKITPIIRATIGCASNNLATKPVIAIKTSNTTDAIGAMAIANFMTASIILPINVAILGAFSLIYDINLLNPSDCPIDSDHVLKPLAIVANVCSNPDELLPKILNKLIIPIKTSENIFTIDGKFSLT